MALCPCCGEPLYYHCRVERIIRDSSGTENIYSIRVLKCINNKCPTKYHRELPDIIIPYKRYDTESIEEALTRRGIEISVAADESTIYRWRKWFSANAISIIMALLSVAAVIGDNNESSSLSNKNQYSNQPIESIKSILMRKADWLKETVRVLVNASKWVINRSAFLTG